MAIKNKLEVFKHYLVLDQTDLPPDRVTMSIDSMDAFDNQLYIGTNEGMLLLYKIEDLKGWTSTNQVQIDLTSTPGEGRQFKAQLLHKNYFDLQQQQPKLKGASGRGHVTHIKVSPQINRAFVVIEGNLIVVHSQNLELRDLGQAMIKNVLSFCINEQSYQTPLEICIGLRNRISLYNFFLHPDQLQNTRDIALNNENPQSIALDATTICAALVSPDMKTGKYSLIQIRNNPAQIQELCNIPKDEVSHPFVKRARNGNFFFNVGLCQFTSTVGESKHVPILWERNIKSSVFLFPYLVSATASQVFIHSMLNQQEKQDFKFKDHRAICTSTRGDEIRVLLASEKAVYCLKSTGLQYQVEYLLDSRQIEEGLQLAKVEHAFLKSRSTQATADSYLVKVKQRVGLLYLQGGDYQAACQQLLDGQMDPREIISLIPGLLLKGSNYEMVHKDCETVRGRMDQETDQEKIFKFKNFMITYLDSVRTEPVASNLKEEIDTAVLGLLAQVHSKDLVPFIETRTTINYEAGVSVLTKESRFYALGIFYSFNREIQKAIETWISIEDGVTQDTSFPGFSFLMEYLSNLGYHELVMKYAKWALDCDQLKAVCIFTKRPPDEILSEILSFENILHLLSDYPFAKKVYLSHLVTERDITEEKHHTDYALLLLRELLTMKKQRKPDESLIENTRKEFNDFLIFSKYYDPIPVQSELTQTDYYPEMSILHGRMDQHEKALEILVYKFGDNNKALEYCIDHSKGKNRNIRQDIYGKLLKVYLDPKDGHTPLFEEALLLLNNSNVDINPRVALQLIPDEWSVKKLGLFLQRSLRRHNHYYRTTAIEHNLAKWEHVRVKRQIIDEDCKRAFITENLECQLCKQYIHDSAFVRYPNGVLIHMKCMKNKNICPVTGIWFGGTN